MRCGCMCTNIVNMHILNMKYLVWHSSLFVPVLLRVTNGIEAGSLFHFYFNPFSTSWWPTTLPLITILRITGMPTFRYEHQQSQSTPWSRSCVMEWFSCDTCMHSLHIHAHALNEMLSQSALHWSSLGVMMPSSVVHTRKDRPFRGCHPSSAALGRLCPEATKQPLSGDLPSAADKGWHPWKGLTAQWHSNSSSVPFSNTHMYVL